MREKYWWIERERERGKKQRGERGKALWFPVAIERSRKKKQGKRETEKPLPQITRLVLLFIAGNFCLHQDRERERERERRISLAPTIEAWFVRPPREFVVDQLTGIDHRVSLLAISTLSLSSQRRGRKKNRQNWKSSRHPVYCVFPLIFPTVRRSHAGEKERSFAVIAACSSR